MSQVIGQKEDVVVKPPKTPHRIAAQSVAAL